MNIPPETARAQGRHGVKGAVHGIKGGRPRLDLTDEERAERRRQQHEAYRRRQGIQPREVLTWEERNERSERANMKRWDEEYSGVWGKLPGQPLSAEEFAKGQKAFRKWVRGSRERGNRLYWPVRWVRRHSREERRQRDDELNGPDAGSPQRAAGRKTRAQLKRQAQQCWVPPLPSLVATPSVGRNQPCPCGSGRKFKKCCGR